MGTPLEDFLSGSSLLITHTHTPMTALCTAIATPDSILLPRVLSLSLYLSIYLYLFSQFGMLFTKAMAHLYCAIML